MRLIRFFIFCLCMDLFLVGTPQKSLLKEFPVEFSKYLELNLKTGGIIDISGWNKPKVSVNVNFTKISMKDFDIISNKNEKGIFIKSQYQGKNHPTISRFSFIIKVPFQFDIHLKSNGGGISIHQVQGKITGKTLSGFLKLKELKGYINLKTLNGNIQLMNSDIDGLLRTHRGGVLIKNVKGDISGNSINGNVIYNNVIPRTGETFNNVVQISTKDNDINVANAPSGAVLKTINGDIYINSVKNFIKAVSINGDIHIDSIDGWAEAKSIDGDISINMTGDLNKGKRDITLFSNRGDIYLSVPKGLSMDIDLKTIFNENQEENCQIYTDFNIPIKKIKQNKKNEFNRMMIGKAKVKDGKHKIKIKVINGDIVLKESKK